MESPVDVVVGGTSYRLVSSAGPDVVRRLARVVDDKLRALGGTARPLAPQALLLAALALAHDLEEEQGRRAEVERRARETLRSVLARIDRAIEEAGTRAPLLVHDGTSPTTFRDDDAPTMDGED